VAIAVIKGTPDCVLHHRRAMQRPSRFRKVGVVRHLTYIGDRYHTSLYTLKGIMRNDFVVHSGHGEGGYLMPKGRVSIVVERCKACGFCVEFCPSHVLALSSAFNSKGYHPPHVVHPEKCSGCDLCGMYCPDFAICASKVDVPKKIEANKEGEK